MLKGKTIILFSSGVVAAGVVLVALSLAFFGSSGVWSTRMMVGLLMAISPLPLVSAAIAFRTLNRHAGATAQLATRDPLTNLYNQATFWDLLEYEAERSRRQGYRFVLLVVDLDNFKAINDQYGHEAGDSLLLAFSEIFKRAIRKGDIGARYGGDNFTAILPVCDEAHGHHVAKRILDGLREHSHTLPNGTPVRITASIGMAVFPDHARDGKDLYLLADNMLFQAKSTGKDRFSIPREQVDLHDIRSAGAKSILIMEALRSKRVIPYFQPIMNVKEQSLLAYEVLTRIVTPERIIPAVEFIEIAEGMGAIGKINAILIERAFALARRENYTGQLFFNLSPKALLNGFIPAVRKLLVDYGIPSSQIVFEITERDTVKSMDKITQQVNELKLEGFRFAIDDFGSGYCSFRHISAFSVDFLKVDGEFIRNMAGEANCTERAIVTNIASLAGQLGIKTIAEYVESESILGNVESAGIDYAQGYYIQRPSPYLNFRTLPSSQPGALNA